MEKVSLNSRVSLSRTIPSRVGVFFVGDSPIFLEFREGSKVTSRVYLSSLTGLEEA